MKTSSLARVALALLCAAATLPAQQAPDQLIELKASGARVFAASRGQALGAPAGTPGAAVRNFLSAQGKSARALDSLAPISETTAANGVRHLRFGQSVNGLDVYGTYVKASVNARGELIHLIEILPEPPGQLVRSNVTARAALEAALRELHPGRTFQLTEQPARGSTVPFSSGDNFFFRNPTATRVALPLAGGAMQEGWLVETWTGADNQLHHTLIANGGRVLDVESRTANDQYNVFVEHPTFTLNGVTRGAAQAIVSGPGAGNAQSTNGWISADGRTAGIQRQFRMSGNNVDTYLDVDANNSPDAAGNTIAGDSFTTAAVLTDAPTTATNRQVAIQNLFWANNLIHDKLYRHGFIESMGNFQQNNFGRGGAGNDSVLAEAQDGSGTNNANFSTPTDGSNPRMQMFLWNLTSPNRDGDVDTDIIFHEYGHGFTWRAIGSMSGCMSGAIGEGTSDVLAILMNQDDVVGEYSYNNANGIRRWPYTNYPRTYGQLTNEGVHAGGELMAAIMWKAKSLLNDDDRLWTLMVDGTNYTPAGPKFENMRDGMVQAAGGLTTEGCKIYQAFADFGVGQGASGSCTTKGFLFPTTSWSVSQSFTMPVACQSPVTDLAVTAVNAPSSVTPGSVNSVSVTVQNVGNQNVGGFNVTLDATGGTVSSPVAVASLAAGASTTQNFTWTAPASTGDVTLTGSHNYPDGSAGNNSLARTVSVATAPAITLTVTSRNQRGSKYADLAWSPSGSGSVDIFKNNSLLVTTANDGAHTDGPQVKGSTVTFRVCLTGTSTCSNSVTLTF